MIRPRRDPLAAAAPEGAARLLRAQLRRVDAAAARLARGRDPEALHDYRVGLRRLRALAGAFSAELRGRVGKRLRRRLSKQARRTGKGRDGEVMLAWLGVRLPRLPARARPPAADWRESLARAQTLERARLLREIPARHARLAAKLRTRLARPLPAQPSESLGVVWNRRLLEARGAWVAAIAAAATPHAKPAAEHAARIAGKKYRYLLDPWPHQDARLRREVRQLKRMQTLLGELHDREVLREALKRREELSAVRTLAGREAAVLRRQFHAAAARLATRDSALATGASRPAPRH